MARTPRLDPYLRLIYRLYEASYLLDILGRVRGPHHVTNLDFSTIFAVRRRFLKNIAFLCDYKKGGPTSTAVAIEDGEKCNTFWIASNEGPQEAVLEFVMSVISKAEAFHKEPDDKKVSAEVDLTRVCVDFASSRIRKQSHGLSSSAGRCRQFIMEAMPDMQDLGAWLRQFEYHHYEDLQGICQSAYEARKDPEMEVLLRLSGGLTGEAIVPVKIASLFRKVRHLIARLAAHIRAVKEFIEDVRHMEDLLDEYDVALVPKPTCVPRLQADGHTNLRGILRRMMRSEDMRFPVLFEYLSDLDEQTGLERQVQERFDPGKTPPCVHAEIQMLHHFYDSGRKFFADDNYIATSKPACFTCKSYFRHHPANYVEPDSHEKVYPNWGPIRLAQRPTRDDPSWIEHRKVVQNVISDLAREVLNEIERRRRPPSHQDHPDTTTGLTASSCALSDYSLDSSDFSDSQNENLSGSNELECETDSDSTGGAEI